MIIGIVDVGIGNIGSLTGVLNYLGLNTKLLEQPKDFANCTHLILPGVGTFNEGMTRLRAMNIAESIIDFAHSGRPTLGICLGMHLLATSGEEGGVNTGLSLIPGNITHLPVLNGYRLPHIGWNTVAELKHHPLTKGFKQSVDFYFVHSYCFNPASVESMVGITDYGIEFCSCVGKENVFGVQFHPEKSQRNGMILLENFCSWDGNA